MGVEAQTRTSASSGFARLGTRHHTLTAQLGSVANLLYAIFRAHRGGDVRFRDALGKGHHERSQPDRDTRFAARKRPVAQSSSKPSYLLP